MKPSDNLMALLERLTRVLHNEAHSGGLKPAQWEVLRYLARANRFSRSPSAVTTYLGITKGTVSQTLNALEQKSLIHKQTDPADRRNLRIDLTQDAFELLQHDPLASFAASVSQLLPEDRQKLESGLGDLLRDVLERRGGRLFGVCHSCRFFQANAPNGTPHRCGLLKVPLTDDDSGRICLEQELPVDGATLSVASSSAANCSPVSPTR